MTSTERTLIARRNQQAAARRIRGRGGMVEQRVPSPSICPECGGPGLVDGTMPDHGETIYTCPTNRCGDWYTMSAARRASR